MCEQPASEDWNVYYIGYSLSHLSGQLIKYLIKIFQEAMESMIKLKFASPPVRYLKNNYAHNNSKKTKVGHMYILDFRFKKKAVTFCVFITIGRVQILHYFHFKCNTSQLSNKNDQEMILFSNKSLLDDTRIQICVLELLASV